MNCFVREHAFRARRYFGHFDFLLVQLFDRDGRQQSRVERYGSYVERLVQISELERVIRIV